MCARILHVLYTVNCGCIKMLVVGTPTMEHSSYLVHVYEILVNLYLTDSSSRVWVVRVSTWMEAGREVMWAMQEGEPGLEHAQVHSSAKAWP